MKKKNRHQMSYHMKVSGILMIYTTLDWPTLLGIGNEDNMPEITRKEILKITRKRDDKYQNDPRVKIERKRYHEEARRKNKSLLQDRSLLSEEKSKGSRSPKRNFFRSERKIRGMDIQDHVASEQSTESLETEDEEKK
jgi:hypothetical protein